MDAKARLVAVKKLNKGANNGIKVAVKAKVMENKYSKLCREKIVDHLRSMRVDVDSMFRAAPSVSSSRQVAASSVNVGNFVEVDADRTPGWNSEGEVAMVIGVTNNFSDVK